MVYADELIDLFDNAELSVELMEPHYPETMLLEGIEVCEYFAHMYLKAAAQLKEEG